MAQFWFPTSHCWLWLWWLFRQHFVWKPEKRRIRENVKEELVGEQGLFILQKNQKWTFLLWALPRIVSFMFWFLLFITSTWVWLGKLFLIEWLLCLHLGLTLLHKYMNEKLDSEICWTCQQMNLISSWPLIGLFLAMITLHDSSPKMWNMLKNIVGTCNSLQTASLNSSVPSTHAVAVGACHWGDVMGTGKSGLKLCSVHSA